MSTSTVVTSDRAHRPFTPTVMAVISFVDTDGTAATVEAVRRQVYGVAATVIVGGGDEGERIATELGLEHHATIRELLDGVGSEVEAVWMLHGDSHPRPDALGALVSEMGRQDASMVGSKILLADRPDRLESVGSATDVFGEPYSGLDPGEIDFEQYDVVRDVAFLSGVSVLIRRDLLKGLRGLDPVLAPVAAGQDLSQRARVAGGRVVVVPSSEVLHAGRCAHDVADWRELAGRMRSIIKAYRWMTLAWVLPVGALIGLFEGMIRLLLGQPRPLFDHVRAAGWNVVHLWGTLRERRLLDRVRAAGDEELFRYQVSGSVRIRELATEIGERMGWTVDEIDAARPEPEPAVDRAGPVVAGVVLVAAAITARRLIAGALPMSGFSLPASPDHWSVLESFAGGWNPAGLGSPEPTHPAAGLVALVGLAAGGWSQGLLAVVGIVLGVAGTGRLLHRLGVSGPSRYLAGLVVLFGPFASMAARTGYWPAVVAAGVAPWVVASCIPGEGSKTTQWGGLVVGSMILAGLLPAGFVIPLAASAVAVVLLGMPRSVLWRGVVGTGAGYLAASAYLLRTDPADLFGGFPQIGAPSPFLGMLASIAVAATLLASPGERMRPAVWGGAIAGVGLAVAAWFPQGEVGMASLVFGGLGVGVLTGAALPFDLEATRLRSSLDVVGSLAAGLLVVASLVGLPGGRAGLPEDRWSGRLDFVSSLAPEEGPGRVLVVGDPGSLPGGWRVGNGYAYRLVWGTQPTLDQAWLPAEREGDRQLAAVLSEIDRGDVLHPGEALAEFAIRWIVILDGAPLAQSLRAQVDLEPIPVAPDVVVFENTVARPRVEAPGWVETRSGGEGPPSAESVRLADNAFPRWGPDWEQDGWANRMSASQGRLIYRNDPMGMWPALAAGVTLVAGLVAMVVGRFRR